MHKEGNKWIFNKTDTWLVGVIVVILAAAGTSVYTIIKNKSGASFVNSTQAGGIAQNISSTCSIQASLEPDFNTATSSPAPIPISTASPSSTPTIGITPSPIPTSSPLPTASPSATPTSYGTLSLQASQYFAQPSTATSVRGSGVMTGQNRKFELSTISTVHCSKVITNADGSNARAVALVQGDGILTDFTKPAGSQSVKASGVFELLYTPNGLPKIDYFSVTVSTNSLGISNWFGSGISSIGGSLNINQSAAGGSN